MLLEFIHTSYCEDHSVSTLKYEYKYLTKTPDRNLELFQEHTKDQIWSFGTKYKEGSPLGIVQLEFKQLYHQKDK